MVVCVENTLVVVLSNGLQDPSETGRTQGLGEKMGQEFEPTSTPFSELAKNPALVVELLPSLLKVIRNVNLRRLEFTDPNRLISNVIYASSSRSFYVKNLHKLLEISCADQLPIFSAEDQITFRKLDTTSQKSNMVQCFEAILKFLGSSKVPLSDENTKRKYEYLLEELTSSTKHFKDLKTSLTLLAPGSKAKEDKEIICSLETKYDEIDEVLPQSASQLSSSKKHRKSPLRVNTLDYDLDLQERKRTSKEAADLVSERYGFDNKHSQQIARMMKFNNKFQQK